MIVLRESKKITCPKAQQNCPFVFLAGALTVKPILDFLYDESGDVYGFEHNGSEYFYIRNAQNDIIGILGSSGEKVVSYDYDAWGNILSITGSQGETIGKLNPFRYRGYYYDNESGLYYLQSRYYDSVTSRFVNSDGIVQTGQNILDKNMFAYCGNNPVNRIDQSGQSWKDVKNWITSKLTALKDWVSSTFGSGGETVMQYSPEPNVIVPEPSPITVKSGSVNNVVTKRKGNTDKAVVASYTYVENNPLKSSVKLQMNFSSYNFKFTLGMDDISFAGSYTSGNTTSSSRLRLNISELKMGVEIDNTIQWDANDSTTYYSNTSVNGWPLIAAYELVKYGKYQSPDSSYGYPTQRVPA